MPNRALVALCCAAVLAARPGGAAADPAAALPGESSLAPLARAGAIERHTPDTLWERIDGEAELYRAYGLRASAHARWEDPRDPARRLELSVFEFREPLGAFGLFAAFRPPECAPVRPLGNGGCLGDLQGFFWQGERFVLADAAGADPAARAADIGRALEGAASLLGPAPLRPAPLRAFAAAVDTRTVRYQPQHLLGREALPPGLEGAAGGTTLFVSTGTGPGATGVLEAYAGTLAGAVRGEYRGLRTLTGRDPALGTVTLLAGGQGLAGARAAADERVLSLLAELLARHEGEAGDGSW